MIKNRNPNLIGLQIALRIDDFEQYCDTLITPYRAAPVLLLEGDTLILKTMQFALIPSWSNEPRPKFATHNARLETLAEKPTWREAFRRRRCLVPLTHFVEPIYRGEHAGHMVAFRSSGQTEEWLVAAGIWESWVNKSTGEVIESFAVITGSPPPFVASVGHDRCPIFLSFQQGQTWCENSERSSSELFQILTDGRASINLEVERYRPMKPGWEKRKK